MREISKKSSILDAQRIRARDENIVGMGNRSARKEEEEMKVKYKVVGLAVGPVETQCFDVSPFFSF